MMPSRAFPSCPARNHYCSLTRNPQVLEGQAAEAARGAATYGRGAQLLGESNQLLAEAVQGLQQTQVGKGHSCWLEIGGVMGICCHALQGAGCLGWPVYCGLVLTVGCPASCPACR